VSPPVTSTPIFGVSTSSDPLQVAALAGGLLLAFKLGAKVGSSNRNSNRGRGRGRSRGRGRGRGRCRRCHGKRMAENEEVMDEEELLESFFVKIGKGGETGCFQRLLCDIAADPEKFPEDVPLLTAVEVDMETLTDPMAKSVLKSLQVAETTGQEGRSVGTCEQIFDQCKQTGLQMKERIHQVLAQSNEISQ